MPFLFRSLSFSRVNQHGLRLLLSVLVGILGFPTLAGQAPLNDECSGAVPVVVPTFGTVNFFSVNTNAATESLPRPVCTSSSADDDVWYSFQPTSPGLRVRYRNAELPAGSSGVGYSIVDACGGTEVACNFRFGDGVEGDEVVELFIPFDLESTYYIRVFTQGNGGGGTFEFGLQPAVENDGCSGAITLPVQNEGACQFRRISTDANTLSSSPSTICPQGGSNNDDEFYRFVATAEYLTFTYENMVANVGATTGLGYSIHDGCSGSELFCDFSFGDGVSGSQIANTGAPFELGRDYVVRLYLEGSTSAGLFDFCIQQTSCVIPTVRLSNNFMDCPGAGFRQNILITDLGSATSLTVTSDAGINPLTFTAPGFQMTDPFPTEGRYGLTMSDTNNPGCSVSFTVDAFCPAANQTCETAATLAVNPAGSCAQLTEFNNYYASNGEYPIAPVCSRFSGGDLFYRFTAPSEAIRLRFSEMPYAPLCAVINEDNCNDGGLQVASGSLRDPGNLVLAGMTPGDSYTLRLYDGFDDDLGKISFCAQEFSALPAELLRFEGRRRGKANTITWSTGAESGVSHFELLARSAGGHWQVVGQMPAQYTDGGAYEILHVTAASEQAYQLRTVDLDGSISLSDVIVVTTRRAGGLRAYPNPTSGMVNIDLPAGVSGARIVVRDWQGSIVHSIDNASGNGINLSGVPAGVYLVTVSYGGRQYHSRVVRR